MSNEIELLCSPVVKNIQARVMGADDDRLVFADIKFQVSVPYFEIGQFLEGSDHLWVTDLDAKTTPRFPGVGTFTLKRKWENVDLKLAPDVSYFDPVDGNGDGKTFYEMVTNHMTGGRVHKMSFDPFLDTAVLSFTYTVAMPGMDIGKLVDRVLNQQVGIHLYSAQKELL